MIFWAKNSCHTPPQQLKVHRDAHMDLSRFERDRIPQLSSEGVLQIEGAGFNPDMYPSTETKRIVFQVIFRKLPLVGAAIEKEIHVGIPVEKESQLKGIEQVCGGYDLVGVEAPDESDAADVEHLVVIVRTVQQRPGLHAGRDDKMPAGRDVPDYPSGKTVAGLLHWQPFVCFGLNATVGDNAARTRRQVRIHIHALPRVEKIVQPSDMDL